MPVIASPSQIDQWYALPFETRDSTTLDNWLGNTSDAAAPAPAPSAPAPTAPFPQDWNVGPIDQPGRTKVQKDAGQVFNTPGWTPPPPGPNASAPRPSVNPGVVYTDAQGNGYDVPALAAAWGNPSFKNDPINARVGDILSQYGYGGGSATVAAKAGTSSGSAPADTTTPYKNSSQDLLLNAVLQRLQQLQTPADTSMSDLFAKYGLAQVDKLNQPPFTDTQNAALLTQHMEPLTQARDTTKQQAAENLARRNIGPSSGVFVDTMNKIDTAYQRGVAGVTNTLNIQGIDQVTKNNQLQLTILSSLADMSRVNQQIADQRSQEAVTTAAIPFNTDLQTLSALSSASGGDNASSLISSLMSLGQLNLNGSTIANQQGSADANAIGSVVGYIMAHHAEFGF